MNRLRLLILVALTLVLASCGSARKAAEPLPFHVALIPPSTRVLPPEVEGDEALEEALAFELPGDEVGAALHAALEEHSFVRATLLAPPDAEDFEDWSLSEQDEHWVREGRRVGADLLLDSQLTYVPHAFGEANDRFWMNVMLFLLGGPACYFTDDRTYTAEARLHGSLFELHALVDRRATLEDARSRLAQVESRFEGTTLDFIDRSGDSTRLYLASVVVPAGFLAQEGTSVERALSRRALVVLSGALSDELVRNRQRILEAGDVAPFWVEAVTVEPGAAGAAEVRGEVVLRQGAVEHIEACTLSVNGAQVDAELGPETLDERRSTHRERVLRYAFRAPLTTGEPVQEVRLNVDGGGRSPIRRSFTCPLSYTPAEPLAVRTAR